MYYGDKIGHAQIIYYFTEVAELKERQKKLDIQEQLDSLQPSFEHCAATEFCFATSGYCERQPPMSKKEYEAHIAAEKARVHETLSRPRRTSGTAEIVKLFDYNN